MKILFGLFSLLITTGVGAAPNYMFRDTGLNDCHDPYTNVVCIIDIRARMTENTIKLNSDSFKEAKLNGYEGDKVVLLYTYFGDKNPVCMYGAGHSLVGTDTIKIIKNSGTRQIKRDFGPVVMMTTELFLTDNRGYMMSPKADRNKMVSHVVIYSGTITECIHNGSSHFTIRGPYLTNGRIVGNDRN